MKNPFFNLIEEQLEKQPEGIVALVFFKSGQALMGALRPAKLKGGDRVEGFYELTAPTQMADPSTRQPVAKLFSNFFHVDMIERVAFEVAAPAIVRPKGAGGIIIPQ